MIKILIIDDSNLKVRSILEVLNTLPEIVLDQIDVKSDRIEALKALNEKQYDLIILDIKLPNKFGEIEIENGGILLLKDILTNSNIIPPFHVIGLTEYDRIKEKYENEFKDILWNLIIYDVQYDEWKKKLLNKVNYLIRSKSELRNPANVKYDYDIAIVTALNNPELKYILKLDAGWEIYEIRNDNVIYHKGIFNTSKGKLRVIAASAEQMGITSTTLLTSKIIFNFRPRYLFMSGKAAGIKQECKLGDILITELSWDYSTGKIKLENGNSTFQPDNKPLVLDPGIKAKFELAITNKDYLEIIQNSWSGEKIENKLEAFLGPLASGPLVIQDDRLISDLLGTQRKVLGVDMETYGIFYTCNYSSNPKPIAVSIKSISDFANSEKSDSFENYSSYTSANYLYHFIINNIIPHKIS